MAELTFQESYRTHGFLVEIEGTQCPVTKVTGLNEGMTEAIEQPDGGSPTVHKIASGIIKFDALVIERNVDGSRFDGFFKDWFGEMFQLTGNTQTSSVRRNGAVIKLENGQEVLRFAFYGAWVKSSKFSDLEAGSSGLFKQTLELEHEGLERVS
ncbi:phage tail-like protein [Micromonospora sp. A200]|uniref:phage tail protein n=1 Tax=Micromonospora sp. A200 TaxID=2940568 RepID=UPI0024732886|nr:phage tail protein [Micromonospora sp. A200]MDH6463711.1 phage tail-like protein [Micromonospora sp. A200]